MINHGSSLFRDVRYSLRALRKTPAFTLGAVVTVALTVGATTAIFSVVYGVLLRQLPYRDVEQVFWIWSDQPGRDRTPFNVPDFIDYRDSARTLSGFAGFFAYSANLSDEAAAERVQGIRATGNLFDVMGAQARHRPLAAAELTSDPARSMSLSSPNRSGCGDSAATRRLSAARSGSIARSTRSSACWRPASPCRSATSSSCFHSPPIGIRGAAPAIP